MRLLTVSETAHRLQRSEGTIRRWADSGRLPVAARLADGTRLFAVRDVAALAEAQSSRVAS
jgi:excisionase family DNA binding protein